jgi:hypothetical protein
VTAKIFQAKQSAFRDAQRTFKVGLCLDQMLDPVQHAELLFPQPFNERPASETAMWPTEQK